MKHFICDLDDCLIKTDMLLEQWLKAIKSNPLIILLSFVWLLKGKAYLKFKLAKHSTVTADSLPYRQEILDLIKSWKTENTGKVVLASASQKEWVEKVAAHLGIFDTYLASSESVNLKSTQKLAAIQELIGQDEFTYAGDSAADLVIWEKASEIIAVNPSAKVKSKIQSLQKKTTWIQDKPSPWRFLIKQLRPHQWVKNALIFLPALAGHKIFEWPTFQSGLIAFAGFSASASFVYVLNDLLDLNSDRNHRTKKNRPFASGNLSLLWGFALLPALLLIAAVTTFFLPPLFAVVIVGYLVLNLFYSFSLKSKEILDIIVLSSMYTLRIFAGAAATDIIVSEWLLSFSTLFFFSLACVKRCTEIARSKNKITIDGRGYRQNDYPIISILGVGSGLLSILIILLYLQSADVRTLYSSPQALWLAMPILLYWVSLIWLKTSRDLIADDPVVYAIKDKTSWICLIFLAAVLWLAT